MGYPRDFEALDALLSRWMEHRKKNPSCDDLLPQNFTAVWTQIVGPILARYARPVKLMGHVLDVEVSSEAWGQALTEQKPFLLLQLKTRLPEFSVRDIQFFSQGAS